MIEISLLKLLGTKELYERYIETIDSFVLTQEAKNIITFLATMYETANQIDWSLCKDSFILEHSRYGSDKLVTYATIFDNIIAEPEVTDPKPILNLLSKRYCASRIADLTMGIAEGTLNKEIADVEKIIEEYKRETGTE